MINKLLPGVALLAGLSTGYAAPPTLTSENPLNGSFAALAASTPFDKFIFFDVLPGTTGFSASIQAVTSGASNPIASFQAVLTKVGGGLTQNFSYAIAPVKSGLITVGNKQVLTALDATLVAGLYQIEVTGTPKVKTTFSYNLKVLTPVPEPESYALLLGGLGVLGLVARRRRAANSAG